MIQKKIKPDCFARVAVDETPTEVTKAHPLSPHAMVAEDENSFRETGTNADRPIICVSDSAPHCLHLRHLSTLHEQPHGPCRFRYTNKQHEQAQSTFNISRRLSGSLTGHVETGIQITNTRTTTNNGQTQEQTQSNHRDGLINHSHFLFSLYFFLHTE